MPLEPSLDDDTAVALEDGYAPVISLPFWRVVGDPPAEGNPDRQYFENLLTDRRWSDVIILNRSRNTDPLHPPMEHRAHHLILGPASMSLDEQIIKSKQLRRDGSAEIILPNLPNTAIKTLIEYIYTGRHTTSSLSCPYLLKYDSDFPLQIEGLREYLITHSVNYIVDQVTKIHLVTGNDCYDQRTQGAKQILIILEIFEILWYSLLTIEERELCRPVILIMFQRLPKLEMNPTFVSWWERHRDDDNNIVIMARNLLHENNGGLERQNESTPDVNDAGNTQFGRHNRALSF